MNNFPIIKTECAEFHKETFFLNFSIQKSIRFSNRLSFSRFSSHRNSRRAPAYPTKRNPSFPFFYAGHVGAASNRAERCLEIFPVCSARTDELLAIVSNANKYATASASKLARKGEKMRANSKLESELSRTAESREFSEKMRNKMKRLHKEYIKKLN